LKNVFPSLSGARQELISIPGIPPDLLSPPEGCEFEERCPFALDICVSTKPEYTEISDGHYSACHRIDELENLRDKAANPKTWEHTRAMTAERGVQ
jgi:oligopeptide/dipeptide ABC transporter ATP-binding protein